MTKCWKFTGLRTTEEKNMQKIAIAGYGTVGGGVAEILRRNAAKIAESAGEPV